MQNDGATVVPMSLSGGGALPHTTTCPPLIWHSRLWATSLEHLQISVQTLRARLSPSALRTSRSAWILGCSVLNGRLVQRSSLSPAS